MSIIHIVILFFAIVALLIIGKKPVNAIYSIFLLTFFRGLMIYPLGISPFIINLLFQLLIIFLFIQVLLIKKAANKRLHFPGIKIFILYTFIVILSAIINNSDFYTSYSFYKHTLNAYLFLISIYNLNSPGWQTDKIIKFIFSLSLLQIIASILKFIYYGRLESIIGTISYTSGSYSTIFPLIAISFLFLYYLISERKYKYLIYALGFLFMAWVGNKRGIYFYLIIIVLLDFFLYYKVVLRKKVLTPIVVRSLFVGIFLSFGIFYFGVRYSPTLNPEHKVGGSFDIKFIQEYLIAYNIGKNDQYAGRGGSMLLLSEYFEKEKNITPKIIGLGPDHLLHKELRGEQSHFIFKMDNIIPTGVFYYIISIGVSGSIVIMWFYLFFGYKVLQISKQNLKNYWKSISLATLTTVIIAIMDFLTYSRAFVSAQLLNVILFYFVGILLKNSNYMFRKNYTEL